MNNRRMFSNRIANSAKFLQMPADAQLLYFHMVLRADDDGIVEAYPITKLISPAPDSFKILIVKNFIKQLNEDQVVVITDWTEHNKIRADRKVNSIYLPLLKEKCPKISILEPKARTDVIGGLRHTAIKEETSDLPYSFSYKIRKVFIGKKCPLCGKIMGDANKNDTPSIQHNIPLSKGGKHELGNISVVCTYCNIVKKDIETDELNAKEVTDIWEKMLGRTMDGIREVKLSKVKLSKVKLEEPFKKEKQTTVCGNEINDLIEKFKDINPSYEKLFKNKTQRSAMASMLKKHGQEKITKLLDILPKTNLLPYSPVITTPVQLETKMGVLLIFIKREEQSTNGIDII